MDPTPQSGMPPSPLSAGPADSVSPSPKRLWRSQFSWPTIGLIVAVIPLTVAGMLLSASDTYGDQWWGVLLLAAPAVPTAWAVLELAWRREPGIIGGTAFRILGISAVAAAVGALTTVVVSALPSFQADVRRYTDAGFHYWFGDRNPHPALTAGLAGWGAAIVVGLLVFVVIVLPLLAATRPRAFAAANMYSTAPADAKANHLAGIALSLVVIAAFAAPTAFVLGWTIAGWVISIIGFVLVIVVVVTQRVDVARRRRTGTPVGISRTKP
ncbi:hypothetical protein [Microbacterium sp. P05]|uniref:hypothetical protein n=1 Tax=Microbacterium sp. P05 TaxID=3366948 RepID=UPI003744C787